ncbi:hypothetical protein DFH07DRAFT_591421 [Mycena maculata]|uniref:Uncharacterized protein n=1 Tax=Mycena maculata TaxID=230809 RepID=A0AAD7IMF3_9AGAR|nr:hypothetical protein DFH07DRAFT_591421 [Mycena maculata]
MSRSPPLPNPSIVNAGNLLPSVNVLFDEVLQRERSNSQSSPGSRSQSAWSGFPGPERNLMGRGNPVLVHGPLPPLQVGPRPTPQPTNRAPPSQRLTTERMNTDTNFPREAPAHVPGAYPVIPNRMGGRYAQTPCHPNGQPHAPGLMPHGAGVQAPSLRHRQARLATSASRQPRQVPGSAVPGSASSNAETSAQTATRLFHELMRAAGNPECSHCIHDIKIESRRQVAGSHGAVFSQYAHGNKPQHPTPLPSIEGLINIPFTPKPLNNQTLYGVSLTEILDFRDVLDDPRERVLDHSLNKIFLTIEHPGYPSVVQQISGNCPHRPVSRFNLAFSVAEAYYSYFTSNTFNPAIVQPSALVVRSITQIRLVNLYTTDRTNFRAHLAYVF